MKSKLTIDLDEDNQPIIKIEYQQSDDVRDKMVKIFLETYESRSRWATFQYVPVEVQNGSVSKIRPVKPSEFKEEEKLLKAIQQV